MIDQADQSKRRCGNAGRRIDAETAIAVRFFFLIRKIIKIQLENACIS